MYWLLIDGRFINLELVQEIAFEEGQGFDFWTLRFNDGENTLYKEPSERRERIVKALERLMVPGFLDE